MQDRPWRVFLSHTSDLRRHPRRRSFAAAAESAVIRAGHAVLDMAYFAASDVTPAAYCMWALSRADVYVGIVGDRYGHQAPGDGQLSYTEVEFQAATALGLPRLVFLVRTPATQPDIDRSRQQAFRDRLRQSGILTVAAANAGALELALYQALVELSRGPHVVGDRTSWPRGR